MNGSPVSSCSVLIVEDETLLRMMMTEMLEEASTRFSWNVSCDLRSG